MTELRLAVCVVTHDDAADLPACLAAAAALETRSLEVVVVDCASSDGTVEAARAFAPPDGVRFEVVPLPANRGFAGGMNEALARTSAPWVLTLNADARPAPDYAERLLARAAAAEARGLAVGAVTGRLVRFAGPDEAPGRRLLDACGMRLVPTWRHLDRGSGEEDRGQHRRPERVFGATGAASLFARRALDDVALDGDVFDPRFHSFREDAELAFRLRERGWEVLYEPDARCEHRRVSLPERRSRMPPAVNYHSLKNRYLLRLYHQSWPNLLWTLPFAAWRDLLALGHVLLRERSSLGAYGWLWRNRRELLARRRAIRARRTVPRWAIERWFLSRGRPL
ncbi:MAG TPA: glycosyltransferase [Thermoanaerobaculia bacterium]|nr:glycosyltransferase [Thermoanaerobaculia bacterium]